MGKTKESKMGFFQTFFMVIGIITTVLVGFFALIIILFLLFKPAGFNVLGMIQAIVSPNSVESSYDHPYLTTQQELLLEAAGINVSELPTEITPAQQQCAIDVLGAERASEIIAGSTPSVSEILAVKGCFE